MIHDNVLIAHEFIHLLRSSKNGPNKGCMVKLDMSKAYDRVEWCFLERVMLKLGFLCGWVNKIMNCVQTVKYKVKYNSSLTDVIISERGLRQGDPLSPYIFLFCMDAFFRIQASKDGPRINHLFFIDDALLFIRNHRSKVEACMKILDNFEKMSGQRINVDKSMVCFSPKTPIPQRAATNELFHIKVVDNLDSYLGLPISVGKKKSDAFKSIVNRTTSRINSWSKRLLSSAGKEIFVKSVIQSIFGRTIDKPSFT
ncbi:reverse transcriptase [Gossypium australe]|uniref:Reverse transcriptase n=1 Tax=Gossypium australe TaxID=47621 RepID=A0A5B6VMR8_9ROSI|nr:reverse transcriptase [Gossypium australe]